MTKQTDIEKLLQWAIIDELPKGMPVACSSWQAIEKYGALGARVRKSYPGGGDGLGFIDGEPHADARAVARALNRLPSHVSFDDVAEVSLLLGPLSVLDIHQAASRAIAKAPFSLRATVHFHGCMRSRPDWRIGAPMPKRMLRPRSNDAVVQWNDASGEVREGRAPGGRYPVNSAARCPLEWSPSAGELVEARAEYVIWHRGLTLLIVALQAETLTDHVVVDRPLAAAAPWDALDPPPVILREPARKMSTLPLTPRRAAALPPLESDIERRARQSRQRRRGPSCAKQAVCIDGTGGF